MMLAEFLHKPCCEQSQYRRPIHGYIYPWCDKDLLRNKMVYRLELQCLQSKKQNVTKTCLVPVALGSSHLLHFRLTTPNSCLTTKAEPWMAATAASFFTSISNKKLWLGAWYKTSGSWRWPLVAPYAWCNPLEGCSFDECWAKMDEQGLGHPNPSPLVCIPRPACAWPCCYPNDQGMAAHTRTKR